MYKAFTVTIQLAIVGFDIHKLLNNSHSSITEFEFTPECVVFDLLSIGLYHGWLVDPQNADTCSAIGGVSYNQLVEKIIASKQDGAETKLVSEGKDDSVLELDSCQTEIY